MKHSKILYLFILFVLSALSGKTKPVTENNGAWKTFSEVPKLSGKILIDGNLNEPGWNSAAIIQNFYNTQNAEPEKADVKAAVLYDESNLYFSFMIPKPANEPELKKCFLSDEWDLRVVPNVSIYLDPDHNHGVYYRFIIDSHGNKQDLRVDDESWKVDWLANVNETNNKLVMEIQIPVSELAGKIRAGGIWGFNVTIDGSMK